MKILAVIIAVIALGYFWKKHLDSSAAKPHGTSGCPPVGPLTPTQAEMCPDDPRAIFAGSGVSEFAASPSPTHREGPQYAATFDDIGYDPAFMDDSILPGAVEV
jgi:hypothetical protein